jgi:hypothetical protein
MLWTTAMLAEKTRLTQRHIRNLINSGKIEAQKAGHDWIISDDEAKRFLTERGIIEESKEESSE